MQQELSFLKILQFYSPDPISFRENLIGYLSDDAGLWGYDAFYPYLFDFMRGTPIEHVISSIKRAVPFKHQKSTYEKRLREIESKLDFSGARNFYHMKKSFRIELGGLTMKIPQNIQYTTAEGPKMFVSLFDKNSGLNEDTLGLALGILNEEVNSSLLGDGLSPELIYFDDGQLGRATLENTVVAEHDEVMEWYRYCLQTLRELHVPSSVKLPKRPKIDPDQLGLDI